MRTIAFWGLTALWLCASMAGAADKPAGASAEKGDQGAAEKPAAQDETATPGDGKDPAPASDAAPETAGPATDGPPVAVIMDDDLPLYRRVMTGVALESQRRLAVFHLGGDVANKEPVLAAALAEKPVAIIAMGPRSLAAAEAADVPVLFCMVPRIEAYRFTKSDVAGVRLEVPYQQQLAALKKLVPAAESVGVLYNPELSKSTFAEVDKAAAVHDLKLVGLEVAEAEDVDKALTAGKGSFGALFMVSDPTVLNVAAVDAMVAYSEAEKAPVVALTARFVERGALLAFGVDYAEVGRQVGKMTNQVLDGDVQIEKLGSVEPDGVELAYSQSAADKLGLGEAMAGQVMSYAADKGLTVKVFR